MSTHLRVKNEFEKRFGESPASIVRAPGRVNLIGEGSSAPGAFTMAVSMC